MSTLIQFIKDNFKTIAITILIYQVILTILFFSTENLIILASIIVIFALYILITNFKDDIVGFFKK